MANRARELATQIIKALNKALDETAPVEFKALGGVQIGDGAIAKIIPAISAYGDEREREALETAARIVEQPFGGQAHTEASNQRIHLVNELARQIRALKNEPKRVRSLLKESK